MRDVRDLALTETVADVEHCAADAAVLARDEGCLLRRGANRLGDRREPATLRTRPVGAHSAGVGRVAERVPTEHHVQ